MTTKFTTWLWEQFPSYWHDNDTNKDINNQGTAERLLCVMGLEIDNEVVAKIDNYLDLLDAQITPEEFLDHISDVLGNPPNMFSDTAQYRNILSYIVSVYKVKGTVKGYEAFFNLLGFDVIITEYVNTGNNYDNGETYDAGLGVTLYDVNKCEPCADYEIVFTSQFPDTNSPDDLFGDALQRLEEAVTFIEPINANLIFVQYLIPIIDTFNVAAEECIEVFTITPTNYDDTNDYDNNEFYDINIDVLIYSWGEKPYGLLIDLDFGVDNISDFTEINTDGTLAYNIASGHLQITGAPVSNIPPDAFLKHDMFFGLETWIMTTEFTAKTLAAIDESFNIGWEPHSSNLAPSPRIIYYHYRRTAPNIQSGDLYKSYDDGVATSVQTSAVQPEVNDVFKVTLEKTWNSLILTVENITDPEVISHTDVYDLSDSSTDLFLGTGHPVIGSGGGDHDVKYFKVESNEIKNIETGYWMIGDGTFSGYEASSDANRIISKLRVAHPALNFTLEGGVGDTMSTHLSKGPAGWTGLSNPSQVIIMVNPDDIITNTLATVQANYGNLISGITAEGVNKFIHVECLPQAGNTDINTFNTWLDTNYNSGIHTRVEINATFNDGLDDMDATYSDDGRYPNDAGQTVIFTAITAEI